MADEDVLSTADLTITLRAQSLSVGRVSAGDLAGCAWPLLKCLLDAPDRETGFFSLTQEEEELTLVMDERCRAAFDDASAVATVEYAPHRWRAFEIHLGSLAWEVPGLTLFLARLMADANVSILNLSSHDRDFLLVADTDVPAAAALIRDRLARDVDGLKADMEENATVRRSGGSLMGREMLEALEGLSEEGEGEGEEAGEGGEGKNGRGGKAGKSAGAGAGGAGGGGAGAPSANGAEASFPPISPPAYPLRVGPLDAMHSPPSFPLPLPPGHRRMNSGDSFSLLRERSGSAGGGGGGGGGSGELHVRVLPTRLAVVRLQLSMLTSSTHALLNRLLYAPTPSGALGSPRGGTGNDGGEEMTYPFWSYTHTDNEVSLIIDEGSLHSFPDDAIVGSSSRWRPLRLCGRTFGFDETGVVSAMYAPYEEGVPLLNISTFSTNISIVDEEELEKALGAFEIPTEVVPIGGEEAMPIIGGAMPEFTLPQALPHAAEAADG